MNKIFGEFIDKFLIIYLENLLIYTNNEEEHKSHLEKILQRLQKYNLKANVEKCGFFLLEVHFLGHCVIKSGTSMDQQKVHVISKLDNPKNI